MIIDGLRRRSFVVRYLTLLGGETFSKLCVMGTFAYLARVLGPHQFGMIELALSITVFFVLGAESGIGSYGARIIEASPERAPVLVPRVMMLRAMLGVPAYIIILGISARYGVANLGILAIYGLMVLLTPFFTQWVFQGLRQMQWVAGGSLLRYMVFAAMTLLLVRRPSDIVKVAAAEVLGGLALAIFNTTLIRRVLKIRLEWRGAVRGAAALFRETWFLGASDLTWAAMWYSPTIILGWTDIGRTEQVAWLASSVRIVMALHTFVWLYFFNMVPNLSKELHDGIDGWRALIRRSLSTSMWAACFVAVGGVLMAPIITRVVYGWAYERAGLPLRIIVWMIPVTWLSGHFRFSLIVSGHQRFEFLASAVAGVGTAALAFLGARYYGAEGAAAALLAGGIINAVVSGGAMYVLIGSVGLTPALAPLLVCLSSIGIGLAAGRLLGPIAGAVIACGLYIAVTATQWDLSRVQAAWEGRIDAA